MLLQTNSYVVPRDRKGEHSRLVRRFRQTFARLGCDSFEVYEQVGSNWSAGESSGRFVQIMRFRDRRHQLAVQEAERNDPDAQGLIAEFCELINFPYQRQQGLFAVGFYISVLSTTARRQPELTDKTIGPEGEIEEEPATESTATATKPPGPAKPPALVEPGAATRAPIVTPVTPGQVPIITPAPVEPDSAAAEDAWPAVPAEVKPPEHSTFDELADLDELPEVASSASPSDSPAESLSEAPAESLGEESTAPASETPAANPRWQTTDDLADEVEADLTTDLTDVDENGQVRVADEALLQAEAEFAEYTAEPAIGAFDELKPKPPVLEGTILDEGYPHSADALPMNDDEALQALELPPINGQPDAESAHFEEEIKELSAEHELDLDALPEAETEPAPAEESKPRK